MNRRTLASIALFAALPLGCAKMWETPPDTKPNPLTVEYGRSKAPVIDRAAASYDLSQLNIYLRSDPTPTRLEDLGEVKRDLPKLYAAIQKGDVVIHWAGVKDQQGVFAYEQKALTTSGQVLTHQGIATSNAADLKKALNLK